MFDRHDALPSRADAEIKEERKILTLRPLIDREVPIAKAASQSIGDMPVAVHQWLDGDVSERIARRADDESVELWNRIAQEAGSRRRMETPAHVSSRIMAVLPKKAPSRAEALFNPFRLKPVTAMASAAALVAAGVAVGEWLLH